jgi:cytochrome c-type biogenesis protein CcmH/NrfG
MLGGGAGSFARYWLLMRSTDLETQNAHNLYLETLAELGPVGLALLLAAFAVPFGAARRARGHPAATAGSAAFAAFAVHAAVDWDFQLVAVTLAALFCAGALLVSARGAREREARRGGRWIGGAMLAAAAAFAIVAQVGNSALAGSRSALDRDDPARAAQLARRAERWQPWSFEPLEALGEAQLAGGRVAAARFSFRRALALDPPNATLWLELADASPRPGRSQALAAARRLDPRGGGGTPG